jgi:hypothetical protein
MPSPAKDRTGNSSSTLKWIASKNRDMSQLRFSQRCFVRLLVTANVPSSLILVTLMMEAICSSETSILTRVTASHHTRRHSTRTDILWEFMLSSEYRYVIFYVRLCCFRVNIGMSHILHESFLLSFEYWYQEIFYVRIPTFVWISVCQILH